MQIISSILFALSFAAAIAASLLKGRKMGMILTLIFCNNFLGAMGYLVGGSGFEGAIVCLIGCAVAVINFLLDSQNKPIPKWLIAIYGGAFVSVNLYLSGLSPQSIILILATLAYVASLVQRSGAKFRVWLLLNVLMWCVYDLVTVSYSAILSHAGQLLFTVCGMLFHDRKKKTATGQDNV